jgi:hypothetical protein
MSTSPDRIRVSDRLVVAIARWLATHISDDELRAELEAADLTHFTPAQAEAVLELQNELDVTTERGPLELAARDALAAVGLCYSPPAGQPSDGR